MEDLERTITGTLYGSKFFEKDPLSLTWSMHTEKAFVWEQAMLERIESKQPWSARKLNSNVSTLPDGFAVPG